MEEEVVIVGGLSYGDEGKGSVVEYLTKIKKVGLVVRYNGGAQAGHNVKTPDGRHHTFSQFGSGTLMPGVKTHLSRFMILNPLGMIREEKHLQDLGVKDAFQRITVDREALVTTPFQVAVNRLSEIWRGRERHGSCGIGIGQTVEDYLEHGKNVLFAGDLQNPSLTEKKLGFMMELAKEKIEIMLPRIPRTEAVKKELEVLEGKDLINYLVGYFFKFSQWIRLVERNYLTKLLRESRVTIFEGAQGVLLDKEFGFKPHITKTDTTLANANSLINEAEYEGKITRVGVLRGYATRHGAGPFPTEDDELNMRLLDLSNAENQWQGKMRFGWLDLVTSRYGIMADQKIDWIALTSLDQLSGLETLKVCSAYKYAGEINQLTPRFEYELAEGMTKIIAINKPGVNAPDEDNIAKIIFNCKPELDELPGWQEDIGRITNLWEMPKATKDFLTFLQSKDGLNVPIKVISISPTWEGKILIN